MDLYQNWCLGNFRGVFLVELKVVFKCFTFYKDIKNNNFFYNTIETKEDIIHWKKSIKQGGENADLKEIYFIPFFYFANLKHKTYFKKSN